MSFTLMMGAKQTKLDTDLVERSVEHAASVKLVRMKSSAKDAVDFALAYYLGQAVLAEPGGCFHVISKDGGYDPLIEHLRERQIKVYRHGSCADLAFGWPGKTETKKAVKKKAVKKKATAKKAVGENVGPVGVWTERVVENFEDHPKARPGRRKTLATKVGNLIKQAAEGEEVEAVIERMVSEGLVEIDEKGRVEYFLREG